MMDFVTILLNVIMPVFSIVILGYLLGHKLTLQAQTLTRTAYYIFVPAFIFQAISASKIPLEHAAKMVCFIVVTHLIAALGAAVIGKLLGRSREMIAAYAIVAAFGNVGNYGLAVTHFQLGGAALAAATLYYIAISVSAFIVSAGVAGWVRGGYRGAFNRLIRTPAIWALFTGLQVSNTDIAVPLVFSRMIGLLAGAMIPVMLFVLGLQLLEQKKISFSLDVAVTSFSRLLILPALAFCVAIPFHLGEIEVAAGVLQSSMPTAVMATIVAREYGVIPGFVTSVVLFSLLASLVTLPMIMVML